MERNLDNLSAFVEADQCLQAKRISDFSGRLNPAGELLKELAAFRGLAVVSVQDLWRSPNLRG
ncbi:hypothetical protein QK285_11285 [Pseudarthrobacter sp. AL20]|nr:hypothetical protein [Pseudarthrobacter sp. AL20]MDI3195011.1 hypothetical protein [Pseudarthrobacter sp. AL20]